MKGLFCDLGELSFLTTGFLVVLQAASGSKLLSWFCRSPFNAGRLIILKRLQHLKFGVRKRRRRKWSLICLWNTGTVDFWEQKRENCVKASSFSTSHVVPMRPKQTHTYILATSSVTVNGSLLAPLTWGMFWSHSWIYDHFVCVVCIFLFSANTQQIIKCRVLLAYMDTYMRTHSTWR